MENASRTPSDTYNNDNTSRCLCQLHRIKSPENHERNAVGKVGSTVSGTIGDYPDSWN